MSCNQDAIPGHDEVRLDKICALLEGKRISFDGVLRQLARSAAMRDDNGVLSRQSRVCLWCFVLLRTRSQREKTLSAQTQVSSCSPFIAVPRAALLP